MQTVLVIRSGAAGMVYLNGRMAGETDPDHPVTLPVSPFGAHLIELRPFDAGLLPLALRLPLSRGVPLLPAPDSRLCAALWPGGIVELELIPERLPSSSPPRLLARLGEVQFSYEQSVPPRVRCETPHAAHVHSLPESAQPPAVTPLANGFLLTGGCESGQYALVLSPAADSARLMLEGRNITLMEGGAIRLMRPLGDLLGRAALETWAETPAGWQLTVSEPMWLTGGPKWPSSPEETAIAAIESAQLGHEADAASFLAPLAACPEALSQAAQYDGCTPLKYPLPGGETAVGLMKLENGLLRIVPAVYTAVPGGARGGWQLTGLQIRAG